MENISLDPARPKIDGILIRLATRVDLPGLEWDGEYRHFRRIYLEAIEQCERGQGMIWIAELVDVGVIGQLIVSMNSKRNELADGLQRAYIYGVRVRQVYRNQGVGTRLMLAAEMELARLGFRKVTLNVARVNKDARRLYERLGYQVVAFEEGRWHYIDHVGVRHDVHEPAWRMEKSLDVQALH